VDKAPQAAWHALAGVHTTLGELACLARATKPPPRLAAGQPEAFPTAVQMFSNAWTPTSRSPARRTWQCGH